MKIIKVNFKDKEFPDYPTTSIHYSGGRSKDIVKILRSLPENCIVNSITIKDEE